MKSRIRRSLRARRPTDKPCRRRAWRGELGIRAGTAAIAEARGRLEEAASAYGLVAEGWEGYGSGSETLFALLKRARCFDALGLGADRRAAAEAAMHLAEGFGATPLIEFARALAR
ncbi:MAG: hypothetical protein WEA10_07230 [Actinomycetota bacterium]